MFNYLPIRIFISHALWETSFTHPFRPLYSVKLSHSWGVTVHAIQVTLSVVTRFVPPATSVHAGTITMWFIVVILVVSRECHVVTVIHGITFEKTISPNSQAQLTLC